MLVKNLSGKSLDYAVAMCEGLDNFSSIPSIKFYYNPSTDWRSGGEIIEREGLSIKYLTITDDTFRWAATQKPTIKQITPKACYGETALIAAMRCYVASKHGDEIEIPELDM